jgi:hypothetical protein
MRLTRRNKFIKYRRLGGLKMKRTVLLFLVCVALLVAGGVSREASAAERKIAVMWVGKSHRPTDLILGFLPKLRELAPDIQVKLHRQL